MLLKIVNVRHSLFDVGFVSALHIINMESGSKTVGVGGSTRKSCTTHRHTHQHTLQLLEFSIFLVNNGKCDCDFDGARNGNNHNAKPASVSFRNVKAPNEIYNSAFKEWVIHLMIGCVVYEKANSQRN